MALRPIRTFNDPILRKKAKPVDKINGAILETLEDMADTMYQAKGIGLAGPQIGVLRRLVVIDVGEGIFKFINPKITRKEGMVMGTEACLSLPNILGEVERAEKVCVRAINEKLKPFKMEASGLMARALQHEIDHLDGRLFVDIAKDIREGEPEGTGEEFKSILTNMS